MAASSRTDPQASCSLVRSGLGLGLGLRFGLVWSTTVPYLPYISAISPLYLASARGGAEVREAVQVDVVGHEVDLVSVRVRLRLRVRVRVR